MSFFDRFKPKWRHSDPAVRLAAVRELTDQRALSEVATNDGSDDVRLAAIERLTDQAVLEHIAAGKSPHAAIAGAKVTDPGGLARLAQSAAQLPVRQRAIAGVKDSNILLRIAALDPDASIRAQARARAGGPDPASNYLRGMISKLPVAERATAEAVEFSGTLDELCQSLTQDPRFFINGEVVDEDMHGTASVANPTQAPWTVPAFPLGRATIRFLAQTRTPWTSNTDSPEAVSFYHIKVWRTGEDRYDAVANKKHIAPTSDPVTWSQASGSGPQIEV